MVGGAKEDEGVQEGEREGKEGEGGGGETGINAPGLLFIDAGSSGSKCTALPGDLSTLKGEKVDPPLAQMDVGTEEWAPDADGAKYRNLLAAKLKKEYALPEIHGGAFSTAANKNAVPVQATAGMRLIDQGANKAIWDKICNKEGTAGGDTVKFATAASKRCGTIPGTTEGYFEWVAANQARTGTICSGGASLQIATPFYAEEGVQAFKALIDDIEGKKLVDCTNITLANGKPAPVFANADTTKCLGDYIKYHEKGSDDIKGCPAELCGADFKGLGVISFLGLKGQGGFFFGGINEVSAAVEEKCKDKDFVECKETFAAELVKDKFYQRIATWFKAKNRQINEYKFGTAAANAHMAGMKSDPAELGQAVTKAGSGATLEKAVDVLCSKGKGKGKGTGTSIDEAGPLTARPAGYQTCMKAWFTANIATGLFKDSEAKTEENTKADVDWSLGASKAQTEFLEASEGVEAMAHLEHLTNKVQQSLAGDLTAGATMHYANLDNAINVV